MQNIQAFLYKNLYTVLLLFLAGGFAITLAELLITGHYQGIQLVAPVATALGLVGVLLVLFVKRGGLYMLAVVLLLLVTLSGIAGTAQHYLNSGSGGPPAGFTPNTSEVATDQAQAAPSGDFQPSEGGPPSGMGGFPGSNPPPLAPLALTGLGMIALVVAWVRWEPVPKQIDSHVAI